MTRQTFVSRSPEETRALGEKLGVKLQPGAVIACIGELGRGRRAFSRAWPAGSG